MCLPNFFRKGLGRVPTSLIYIYIYIFSFFLFLKYKAFFLLFAFLAKSRALSSFSFDNLPLHSLVLFLTYILFMRRSNIPKSLPKSIFVVATFLVASLSCKFSVSYFPFCVIKKHSLCDYFKTPLDYFWALSFH